MKNKKLILGVLAFVIVGIIFISGCVKKEVGTLFQAEKVLNNSKTQKEI